MPGRGLTDDRTAMRILARQNGCSHGEAVEVRTLSGERAAWLCPDCDAQLPPDHWIAMTERDLLEEEETTDGS
jgi:hypothetical protein